MRKNVPYFEDIKVSPLTDDTPIATLVWCKEHREWERVEEPKVRSIAYEYTGHSTEGTDKEVSTFMG
jgi:hypothetical protein